MQEKTLISCARTGQRLAERWVAMVLWVALEKQFGYSSSDKL
jgi:hypothetical protein